MAFHFRTKGKETGNKSSEGEELKKWILFDQFNKWSFEIGIIKAQITEQVFLLLLKYKKIKPVLWDI